jgi:hypothetical protein
MVVHLRDKELLLLLDNCEQVALAAPQVTELLADVTAPHCKPLWWLLTNSAQSRERDW